MPKKPRDIHIRFWEKVNQKSLNECWPWLGGLSPAGYGRFTVSHKIGIHAHRMAYQLIHSIDLPRDTIVMHTCDNPPCCNPRHLRIGTQADNVHDMDTKGRRNTKGIPKLGCRGSRNGNSKLTEEQVIEILNSDDKLVVLAQKYGVHFSTIADIRNRVTWSHIKQ